MQTLFKMVVWQLGLAACALV